MTVFVSSISFFAGSSAHVTVYDSAGNALSPTVIGWPNLPIGMTASPDMTGTGFLFMSSVITLPTNVTANGPNGAVGTLLVAVTAPLLKFSSP